MIPSPFGASPSRSSLQASSINHSHPSVSNTHKPLRFGSTNFHELGDKDIYMPPTELIDWLDHLENPSKVRTLKDLSRMTARKAYWKSPEGQKSLREALDRRADDLARTTDIGPYRTHIVKLLADEHPNITGKELLRNGVTDVIKNNPRITPKQLKDFISTLFLYEDPSFTSRGFKLGKEGSPPAHAPLIEVEKTKVAQEVREAFNKNYSAWNLKTNKKRKVPRSAIVGHATGLRPLTTRTTIYRRQRTDLRSLPAVRPNTLLQELNQKHTPGLLRQLGITGVRKPSFKRRHSRTVPVKSITIGVKALQEENKPTITVPKPVLSPSTSSMRAISAPIDSERPILEEITNNSNLKRSETKTQRANNSYESSLKRSASSIVIHEDEKTASKENSMPPSVSSSPFQTPLKPFPSPSSRKRPALEETPDFNSSKRRVGDSRKRISLNQSVSAPPLLENPSNRSHVLRAQKSFSGPPNLRRLESIR
jgi:hypothetical protein